MVKGRQGQRVRMYVRGTILGYKRSKSNQYENTSLLQIEGVSTKEDVAWYGGKRIAYCTRPRPRATHQHPVHLGQGHAPARKLRRRARQVPLQPPAQFHG
ncbi:hypothetical protein HU200_026540 [Digitaria exilis]|uniref:Ribosomal protein L35A n=1 Tax=Digitaria exilis TaxID=1010633 RepID=A0A835BZD3_9POAL|nr:hypothetical protein HU200_026540 [Digitaria exilis]